MIIHLNINSNCQTVGTHLTNRLDCVIGFHETPGPEPALNRSTYYLMLKRHRNESFKTAVDRSACLMVVVKFYPIYVGATSPNQTFDYQTINRKSN